ncbi:hypothetical protein [Arthrobacter sp. NA-172]
MSGAPAASTLVEAAGASAFPAGSLDFDADYSGGYFAGHYCRASCDPG